MSTLERDRVLTVAALLILVAPTAGIGLAAGLSGQAPCILVYAGANVGYAEMLASLIRSDYRIKAEVLVASDPEVVSLMAALPTTQSMIIHADNAAEIAALEVSLLNYFRGGGGLIGMKDACYGSSAGRLATEVFPTHANVSVAETSPSRWARTYARRDEMEINSRLSERFQLFSMGTYFSGDRNGQYVEVPGEYVVLYTDQETGSPMVLINGNQAGGRSVAFPGIWVSGVSRLDTYYGKLVANEDFAKMFTNSVLWVQGATRFSDLMGTWNERLEEVEDHRLRLAEEALEGTRKESMRRTVILAGLWAAGLAASGIIVKKTILPRPDARRQPVG